ncbi:hypothetical protein K438DRAFT_1765511 [Mycena galopus ATCC 62051]|nr:hypothetical protein K438DRAFT_1765511 [Mycena galopus ATCC 62051]
MAQARIRLPSLLDLKYGLVNSESTSAYLERNKSGFTKSYNENSLLRDAIHRDTMPQCNSAVNDDPTTLDPILLAELGFPLAELAGAPRRSRSGSTTNHSGHTGVHCGRGRASRGRRCEAEMVRGTASAVKTFMRSAGASLEGSEVGPWNEEKA